ncbi:hypothetical protein PR048_003877 [Dryococelus australis]|uniref:Uncharacterized protein n=1 Tax=Dryococelus australis TaxID=614101 RepID=A0ABQ9IPF6_9NEOP|nr:hypothetical protein PR048_003877 [Dryococelus australis]
MNPAEYHKKMEGRINSQHKDASLNAGDLDLKWTISVLSYLPSGRRPLKIYRFLRPMTLLLEDPHSPK